MLGSMADPAMSDHEGGLRDRAEYGFSCMAGCPADVRCGDVQYGMREDDEDDDGSRTLRSGERLYEYDVVLHDGENTEVKLWCPVKMAPARRKEHGRMYESSSSGALESPACCDCGHVPADVGDTDAIIGAVLADSLSASMALSKPTVGRLSPILRLERGDNGTAFAPLTGGLNGSSSSMALSAPLLAAAVLQGWTSIGRAAAAVGRSRCRCD